MLTKVEVLLSQPTVYGETFVAVGRLRSQERHHPIPVVCRRTTYRTLYIRSVKAPRRVTFLNSIYRDPDLSSDTKRRYSLGLTLSQGSVTESWAICIPMVLSYAR